MQTDMLRPVSYAGRERERERERESADSQRRNLVLGSFPCFRIRTHMLMIVALVERVCFTTPSATGGGADVRAGEGSSLTHIALSKESAERVSERERERERERCDFVMLLCLFMVFA